MKVELSFLLDVPELGKSSKTSVDLPTGSTVAELRRNLEATFPSLVDWIEFLVISVDGNLVRDDFVLSGGQTAVLFLPKAGG